MPVSVIKKDGGRQLFDKQKLFTGISRACEKTNFSSEAIINFVDGIESQIVQDSNKDIKIFTNRRINTQKSKERK